jgi:hypothetical protein
MGTRVDIPFFFLPGLLPQADFQIKLKHHLARPEEETAAANLGLRFVKIKTQSDLHNFAADIDLHNGLLP